MEGEVIMCRRGFHFCKKATDCFEYYPFDPNNKVAEVEALGDVETEGNKSCTNKIHIIRELSWYEVLDLVNTGAANTGRNNSGNMNSGDRNSEYELRQYELGRYELGQYELGRYELRQYELKW